MEDFWKVLSKLEEVRLCILSIPTNCKQPSGTFYRLRKISLTADDSDFTVQLQFIRQCPNLEDLFWRVGKESKVLDEFASDIEHGLWRNLETLDLDHCRGDEYSSRILDHILRITKVNARWRQFGPLSFRSLQHHFSTLKKVNCPEATGSMILEMLCSCPLLEDFTAGSLDAKNIENSPPWVCISMKRLHLRFDFDKSEGHLKPLVFKHLSVMINLEAIRIGGLGYYHTPPPIETRLDMRLMKGLGSLSRWKNIRSIDLSETMQSMEEADVRWMISNWRRAEFIHGKLNQDPQINDNLRAMLRERDIK
ncbi:hypothetical protein BGX27_001106 [Mortierella sp. AM989]|nr:hypothetical protein BGX27_001106 [Mortierella sp. AM989]